MEQEGSIIGNPQTTGQEDSGAVWLAYRALKEESLYHLACDIEKAQDTPLNEFINLHHDVGFMWLPTAVFHHRIAPCEDAKVRGLEPAWERSRGRERERIQSGPEVRHGLYMDLQ